MRSLIIAMLIVGLGGFVSGFVAGFKIEQDRGQPPIITPVPPPTTTMLQEQPI